MHLRFVLQPTRLEDAALPFDHGNCASRYPQQVKGTISCEQVLYNAGIEFLALAQIYDIRLALPDGAVKRVRHYFGVSDVPKKHGNGLRR